MVEGTENRIIAKVQREDEEKEKRGKEHRHCCRKSVYMLRPRASIGKEFVLNSVHHYHHYYYYYVNEFNAKEVDLTYARTPVRPRRLRRRRRNRTSSIGTRSSTWKSRMSSPRSRRSSSRTPSNSLRRSTPSVRRPRPSIHEGQGRSARSMV